MLRSASAPKPLPCFHDLAPMMHEGEMKEDDPVRRSPTVMNPDFISAAELEFSLSLSLSQSTSWLFSPLVVLVAV